MAHLTLEQVAQMVDETRRRRRLQQDPYFYGAEERPGALLSDIDKLGLYGDVVGSEDYASSPTQVGSFSVQEAIPAHKLYGRPGILEELLADPVMNEGPEDEAHWREKYGPARNVGRTVSGVLTRGAGATYGSGGPDRRDVVTVPHEMYGGFDPATMAHEVGHRGFNVMGRPMVGVQEHDVIYGQDPRDWARERALKKYDPGEGKFVQRESWEEPYYQSVEGRELVSQGMFQKANQMARDYQAGLLAEHDEHSGDEAHLEVLRLPQGLLDVVTEPRTKSGVGGDVTPTTLKQAQSMDKPYYFQDGEKKLAVTADQLAKFKKSDRYDSKSKKSALTQWANIAGKEGLSGLIPKKAPSKKKAVGYRNTAMDKIAEWEGGYQGKTFKDVDETRIGFGREAKKGEITTESKEKKWLGKKVDEIGTFLDGAVTVDLTEDQKDALASLVFNVGRTSFKKSKALAALNAGDMEEFRRQAFSKGQGWVKIKGKFSQGLLNRRKKEEKLFFG